VKFFLHALNRRRFAVLLRYGSAVSSALVVAVMLGLLPSSSHTSQPAMSRIAANRGSYTLAAQHCPPTGRGVTSTRANIAVTIVDVHGVVTNATLGLPPAEVQETDWTDVAQSINAAGGAGCRSLALHFYRVNPLDAANAQQECLAIANSQPLLVLDVGVLTSLGASACIPEHKIALASKYLTQDELTKYHPYYLAINDVQDDIIRNGILGLDQLGYFSPRKGFRKIGVVYHSCNPAEETAERTYLKKAGVSNSKIVTFSLGCPAGLQDTPASIQQAVLSFKNAGVTDVTEIDFAGLGGFTQIAQQQHYKPKYLLVDDSFPTTPAAASDAPNLANFNGAIDIVSSGVGEQTTPGYKTDASTAKCNAIFTRLGQLPLLKQPDGYGGAACSYLWFTKALLDHASHLQSDALAPAMHSIGTISFPYPSGPIDFSAIPAGGAHGQSYWRPIAFLASCKCWRVSSPTFNTPFK
jgi:hypothetical protein